MDLIPSDLIIMFLFAKQNSFRVPLLVGGNEWLHGWTLNLMILTLFLGLVRVFLPVVFVVVVVNFVVIIIVAGIFHHKITRFDNIITNGRKSNANIPDVSIGVIATDRALDDQSILVIIIHKNFADEVGSATLRLGCDTLKGIIKPIVQVSNDDIARIKLVFLFLVHVGNGHPHGMISRIVILLVNFVTILVVINILVLHGILTYKGSSFHLDSFSQGKHCLPVHFSADAECTLDRSRIVVVVCFVRWSRIFLPIVVVVVVIINIFILVFLFRNGIVTIILLIVHFIDIDGIARTRHNVRETSLGGSRRRGNADGGVAPRTRDMSSRKDVIGIKRRSGGAGPMVSLALVSPVFDVGYDFDGTRTFAIMSAV
mmetsp:Transcript_14446/g.30375  ORF Transcript_14446/g.30375 Transcript_14446/m.30375 type:complete len:371 (+) Transcript_14446:538-1650(+)